MAGSNGAQVAAMSSAPPTTPKTVVLRLTSEGSPSGVSDGEAAGSVDAKPVDVVTAGKARPPQSVVVNLPEESVGTPVGRVGPSNSEEVIPEPAAEDSYEEAADPRPISPEHSASAARAMRNIPDPPPAAGPLYKCALCGVLVYESQLDYHVLICPDPPDSGAVGGADDQPEVAGSEAKRAAEEAQITPPRDPSSKLASGTPETMSASPATGVGGSVSSRQRAWSGSGRRDNQLPQNQDTQVRRMDARRQQMVAELQERETKECTFAPRINARGSPKTCTRVSDSSGEVRTWSQRGVEHQRNQKLKRVEAQAYADVTLRPKVSRFAEVWSEKQKQAQAATGQAVPTVYERLYFAAMQAAHTRDLRQQEAVEEQSLRSLPATQGDAASGPQTPALSSVSTACGDGYPPSTPERTTLAVATSSTSGRFAPPARRVSTSQLLYDDSFDRRERLKSLSEQVYLNSEEALRDKSQVLSRSRRYYWQMLERQIKVAFDAASGGEPTLKYAQLEDFLVRFGCLKDKAPKTSGSKNSEGHTAAQAAEESRKLSGALWRHLDHQKAGSIDLLTLTVFFHVLMGAVDGADDSVGKTAPNFPPMSTVDEEALAESTKESPRTSPGSSQRRGASSSPTIRTRSESADMNGTEGGIKSGECKSEGNSTAKSNDASPGRRASGGPLAAIFEEEGKDLPGSPVPRLDASEPLNVSVDDEGHRICELLVRFDPFRLRSEFRQLYLHRLHNKLAEKSSLDKSEDSQVLVPDINSQSRAIAEKLIERQKGESGGTLTQHADLLLWRHNQVEAKKEEKRTAAKNEEIDGCTFRPKTNAKKDDGPLEVTAKGSSRYEVLYARALADKERKDARAQADAKARSKDEVKGCTFKPDTGKSERSYNRSNDNTVPVPRGFYETRQRLREAHEVHRQKNQQKEERLSKITPVSGKVSIINSLAPPATAAEKSPAPALGGVDPSSPLLPVAEEQDRRRPLTVERRRSGDPPRSARSPSGRQSPRGGQPQSARGRSNAANHSPAPNSTASPSTPRDNTANRQAAPVVSSSGGGAQSNGEKAGGGSGSTAGTGAAAGSTAPTPAAAEDEESQPPPLLYVDVNIAPGQPPERIVLREGQSVTEVAADFAAKHVLTPALAQRLHGLLKEVLQKQEHLQQPKG
mmetsp:Transcript_71217/g.123657  ORF Transcript_71217/g.123657 Transcript_71217/m.123657 type:complete len:1152 (-) Transcript_71217:105-3560(-)